MGVVLLAVSLSFVWRSFYAMRIPMEDPARKLRPAENEAASEVVKAH